LVSSIFVSDTDPTTHKLSKPFTSSIYSNIWPVGRLTFETFMPLSKCYDNYVKIFKQFVPEYGMYDVVGDFTPLMGDNDTLIGYPQLLGGGPIVNICRIEYSINKKYMNERFQQFQHKVEELIISTGGAFHWGQPYYSSLRNLTQNLRYFDTYVALVKQTDPNGVFSNNFTRSMLNRENIIGGSFYIDALFQANFARIQAIFWCLFIYTIFTMPVASYLRLLKARETYFLIGTILLTLELLFTITICFVHFVLGIVMFIIAIIILILVNFALFVSLEKQQHYLGKRINLNKMLFLD